MRTALLAGLFIFAIAQVSFAQGTDELQLTSNGVTVTISDGGLGDVNPAPNTIAYNNSNFQGWDVILTGGASNTPSTQPYGINIQINTAACVAASCKPLTISYSDKGFTDPVNAGNFTDAFTAASQTGKTSSSTESAWDDTTNTIFGHGTAIGGSLTFTGNTTAGAQSANGGGPAGPSAYSLTLQDVLAGCNTKNCASYNLDGSITATVVPEPATLLLLGTTLTGAGLLFRRKIVSKRR